MKVLMFGWEYPPHISGGLGTACYRLTASMIKQGMEILFVVPKAFGDENDNGSRIVNASDIIMDFSDSYIKDYWHNLSYIEINSHLVPYVGRNDYYNIINQTSINKEQEKNNLFRRFAFSGEYNNNLMEEVEKYAIVAGTIAKQNKFDIIHSHDWLTYKAGVIAKKISNKPLVVHVHATEFDRSGENINKDVYDVEKYGMDNADKIITVSNLTRNIVINKYHQREDKVVTVYNGIVPKEHIINKNNNPFNKKIVTFLGRITFQKGPDYFVEAAEKVLNKDKDIIFVMAGSGDMLNRMVALVAKKGISKNFFFTGFLKGSDVDYLFSMSDVYVMPSVSEPFGISPLEAMRSNVPVIISKQSGVSEVVSYAIKVDFWDIDKMSDAIYALTHYSALSNMLINQGNKEIKKIGWDKAADNVINIYKQLI
ncbi:MAG: glycosyltransferase family 4 protein [Bacteroidales bacterium]|jgi:glycosyltransferase involved in cell wall biosynthesis|nr:glycosyltransferase family 4 protein [Bacteroidales bacterium]